MSDQTNEGQLCCVFWEFQLPFCSDVPEVKVTLINFSFQYDLSCCDSTQQRSLNRLRFVYELAKYA